MSIKKKWVEDNADYVRERQLRKYGITQVDYENLLRSQKYSCAICLTHYDDVPRFKKLNMKHRMHIDHCHTTGKVRGLLCVRCNQGLGNFVDSVLNLKAAINYLERYNEDPESSKD